MGLSRRHSSKNVLGNAACCRCLVSHHEEASYAVLHTWEMEGAAASKRGLRTAPVTHRHTHTHTHTHEHTPSQQAKPPTAQLQVPEAGLLSVSGADCPGHSQPGGCPGSLAPWTASWDCLRYNQN